MKKREKEIKFHFPKNSQLIPLYKASTCLFLIACVGAFSIPLLSSPHLASANSQILKIDDPKFWNHKPLVEIPPSEPVKQFLKGFQGQIAQYKIGDTNKNVLFRWCFTATRDLHPAEDCYKVLGWKCRSIKAVRDSSGHSWSQFKVEEPSGKTTVVRQCYFSVPPDFSTENLEELIANAPSWPDASSWYWAASRPGSEVKLTLALTVSE